MQIPIQTALTTLVTATQEYIQQRQIEQPLIVGIRTGGVWIAEYLNDQLGFKQAIGILDISFYRDDFTRNGLNPQVTGSDLPDTIEDRDILLVDDVLMSGRTVRAAMNELFDYGRPARIHLISLLDVGQRELPIQAQVTGSAMTLEINQRVKVTGPEPLAAEIIDLPNKLAE